MLIGQELGSRHCKKNPVASNQSKFCSAAARLTPAPPYAQIEVNIMMIVR